MAALDLEWFTDHAHVDDELFDGTVWPNGGVLQPQADRPGHGLRLREPDAERYRVN